MNIIAFWEYRPGHPVRVISGPYAGQEGQATGTERTWGTWVKVALPDRKERVWFQAAQLVRLEVETPAAQAANA